MGFSNVVKSIYTNQFRPEYIRQVVLPAGAAATLTADAAGSTYGVWADVALLATVEADTLVVGVVLSNPSATDVFTVDIGSCAGYINAGTLNAVPAAVIAAHRAEVRIDNTITVITAVGEFVSYGGYMPLPFPVWIPSGVGILGKCYGVSAVAVTIDASVVCVQGA